MLFVPFLNTYEKGNHVQNQEQYPHPTQYNEQLRLRNDIETLYAESLCGSMRTPAIYDYDPLAVELYAEDGGLLGSVFENALKDIEQKAVEYPEFNFEVRRRRHERAEYDEMLNMMDNESTNTIVVVSDFPAELQDANQSVGGYDIDRKQAYIRVLAKDGDKLYLYSQSLDGSDRHALEQLYTELGYQAKPGELLGQRLQITLDPQDQHLLIDRLTATYDDMLQQNTGVKHYAGIPMYNIDPIDTYAFVKKQSDIIGLSITMHASGELTYKKQYDMMALLRERYEKAKQGVMEEIQYAKNNIGHLALQHAVVEQQSQQAGTKAQAEGRGFSFCGQTMRASQAAEATDQTGAAGYSSANKTATAEDKFGPLEFKCQKGHWNKRPRNELIDNCKTCNIAVGCGKKPKKIKQNKN